KIQPRPLTCDDFTADVVVAFQFLNGAAHDGFGHEAIRMHRVNAHPSLADSNDFPGVKQTSAFFIAPSDIHHAAGLFTAHHAAGIRAVSGNDLTGGQTYVREKTLVALDQNSAD